MKRSKFNLFKIETSRHTKARGSQWRWAARRATLLTRKLNADITINQGPILIIGYSLRREVSNYIAQLTARRIE